MTPTSTTILYVITDLNLGGVPLYLYRLAKAMRGRGFRPSVVSLAGPGAVTHMLHDDGIEAHSCEGRGPWDFRVIRRLARVITGKRPDIVHAFLFHANVAARRAAKIAGLPRERVVCEIQTVEVQRRWHLWVDRWTHLGCRFTIGNSPSVIEHLAANARIPRHRLRLVRGGIDPARWQDATPIDRSTLGIPTGAPVVLWVGRLDPVKGLETLIRALGPIVASEHDGGPDLRESRLLLVGDGPLRRPLLRLVERCGLTARVHLLGARDDVPALLKAADAFAFPSRTEGLPNALLEAMAAGCPIVTTNVPGCRDLIDHERTGLLVPYGDTDKLAEALRRLLRDRDGAMRLARRAAEEVTRSWHIERTYEACATIYDSIRAEIPAPPQAKTPPHC